MTSRRARKSEERQSELLAFDPISLRIPMAPLLPFEPLTVRIPVAVRLTGIGRSKLYLLIKAGEVEVVKIGSSTLITYASLERLIERGREAATVVKRDRSAL